MAKLAASNNHLTTGFLGTPWLLPALSSIGRDDLAYSMLLLKDYPSWGYEIEQGATTMWERWNSIMPDGSFGPVEMNSFNHYAYGAVGDWMYQNIGGISPVEAGYKTIRIAPDVGGGLTHGSGHLESVHGTIATDWTAATGSFDLAVEVPVNTTAEVVLPAENVYSATEGGALLSDVDGVQGVVDDGDTVTVTVGSGSYDFAVDDANEAVGAILVALDMLSSHVADLADAGDVTTEQRDAIGTALAAVRSDVSDALLAGLDGDADAAAAALAAALSGVRDLRSALPDAGLDAPVLGDLDGSLGALEHQLLNALTSALGVTVTLPPVSGAVLPGATVAGTIEVTNDGVTDLTGLDATVDVAELGSDAVALASLPAGESAQLPVEITVPAHQAPGGYDAELSLDYTSGADSYTVTATTADWATVTSGLELGDLSTTMDGTDVSEHATVTVPVSNTGSADVRAHAALTLPEGWASVPSEDVVVPAGGQVDMQVPVIVPLDHVAGDVPVEVEVRRAGILLSSADDVATFTLPTPPDAAVVDHVDFGDGASESAHAIMAAPSSGTSTEAGYTRRYANANNPGAWYSVQVDVPAGEPFILRNIETYDSANTKKYNVYVDDVLVKTQLVPRTQGGAGVKVYDALIDDPSLTANDGSVRITYEYPLDAAGFYDPSIADTWVLAVPDDTQAPDVSAVVSQAVVGDNGWYRSDAKVTVSATDNRDATPVVETGEDAGWNAYVGPVTVSGEGAHELSYRASDAAGNSSGDLVLPVDIDTTAPVTELSVTRGAGVEGADSAMLELAATDATSGVAVTQYRIDGGDWATYAGAAVEVLGFGEHTVDFASTDVAGNPEMMRQATVSLVDVDQVVAIVAPQVSGAAAIGSRLSATTGTWNTKGLDFAFQWLRNGSPVAGATRSSYRVGAADVGKRVSVRVTASKTGLEPGVAESAASAPVKKASSSAKVKVNKTKLKRKQSLKVTARVSSSLRATGKVLVKLDGRTVKKASLNKHGKASTRIRIGKRGKHKVQVIYRGSRTVSGSRSAPVTVKVR